MTSENLNPTEPLRPEEVQDLDSAKTYIDEVMGEARLAATERAAANGTELKPGEFATIYDNWLYRPEGSHESVPEESVRVIVNTDSRFYYELTRRPDGHMFFRFGVQDGEVISSKAANADTQWSDSSFVENVRRAGKWLDGYRHLYKETTWPITGHQYGQWLDENQELANEANAQGHDSSEDYYEGHNTLRPFESLEEAERYLQALPTVLAEQQISYKRHAEAPAGASAATRQLVESLGIDARYRLTSGRMPDWRGTVRVTDIAGGMYTLLNEVEYEGGTFGDEHISSQQIGYTTSLAASGEPGALVISNSTSYARHTRRGDGMTWTSVGTLIGDPLGRFTDLTDPYLVKRDEADEALAVKDYIRMAAHLRSALELRLLVTPDGEKLIDTMNGPRNETDT